MPTRALTAVDLETLYLVTRKTAPVAAAAVDALESTLQRATPPGYRALMTRVGAGAFVGELTVHGPAAVLEVTAAQRTSGAFEARHAVWSNYEATMAGIDPQTLFALATSNNGDEFVFTGADRVLCFPRHSEEIAEAGPSLGDALAWFARSGVCVRDPVRFDCYDTSIDRDRSSWEVARLDDDEPNIDDLIDALLETEPDHDDGSDPPLTFYYRRLDGAVRVASPGRRVTASGRHLRLSLERDVAAVGAWEDLCEELRLAGWSLRRGA